MCLCFLCWFLALVPRSSFMSAVVPAWSSFTLSQTVLNKRSAPDKRLSGAAFGFRLHHFEQLSLYFPLYFFQRPVIKRKTKRISRPRTSSAQRRQSDRTDPTSRGKSLPSISRSKSLSPRRYGNTQRMSHIGLGSKAPFVDDSSDPLPVSRYNTQTL